MRPVLRQTQPRQSGGHCICLAPRLTRPRERPSFGVLGAYSGAGSCRPPSLPVNSSAQRATHRRVVLTRGSIRRSRQSGRQLSRRAQSCRPLTSVRRDHAVAARGAVRSHPTHFRCRPPSAPPCPAVPSTCQGSRRSSTERRAAAGQCSPSACRTRACAPAPPRILRAGPGPLAEPAEWRRPAEGVALARSATAYSTSLPYEMDLALPALAPPSTQPYLPSAQLQSVR